MSICELCNSLPEEVQIHLKDVILLDECHLDPGSQQLQQQCRTAILNSDAFLSKLLALAKKRSVNDKKVPPGSNAVIRSIFDKRFILSLVCINMGRILEETSVDGVTADPEDILAYYKEALLWFPRSIEAAYYFGRLHKLARTSSPADLAVVEDAWNKALISAAALDDPSLAHASAHACDSCNKMLASALSPAACRREREALAKIREALILHLCQNSRLEEARVLLAEDRYAYKLSQEIFHYYEPRICARSQCACLTAATASEKGGGYTVPDGEVKECTNALGMDHVLSPALLQRMQFVFRPDAPFWAEHKYDFYSNASRSVGYFSYLYPFRSRSPRNLIEQVIEQIYTTVASKFASVAENATIGK
jgi:hypothetical protein